MLRGIVSWCLRHRSVVILITLIVFAAGISTGGSLKRELLPSVDFPVLSIATAVPGSDPSSIASEVTEPIEHAVSSLEGVKRHRSFSVDGFSNIIVEYELNQNVDDAQTELERALAQVRLPSSALPPSVSKVGMSGQVSMRLAVVANKETASDLSRMVDEELIPALRKAEGVADVRVRGGESSRLEIRLDPVRLAKYKISPEQVVGALQANNLSLPAGSVVDKDRTLPVRVGGEITSEDQLNKLVVGMAAPTPAPRPAAAAAAKKATIKVIPPRRSFPELASTTDASATTDANASPDATSTNDAGVTTDAGVTRDSGATAEASSPPPTPTLTTTSPPPAAALQPRPVLLKDVAEIKVAGDEKNGVSRTNGLPGLGIEIVKDQDANSVELSNAVEQALHDVKDSMGSADMFVLFDEAEFINESITSLLEEALIGSVLVVLIIFIFLRSGRATIVAAVSIPLSILVGLIFARFGDLSLNIMTLSGLTIAIGRVIDDAIVVLENIYSRIQNGEDPHTAALEGTSEVASAIASSTLAAVAVFLPIGLVGGIIAKFFLSFSLVIAFALLASLVVSITLIPVLATMFLRKAKSSKHVAGPTLLQRGYLPVLRWSLRHRLWTVVIGSAFFVSSLALLAFIPQNFLPSSEEDQLAARVEFPAGTSLEQTSKKIEAYENALGSEKGISSYAVDIGGSDPFSVSSMTLGSNEASIWIQLKEGADADAIAKRLAARGRGLYGQSFSLNRSQGGPQAGQLELVLINPDAKKLRDAESTVVALVKNTKGVKDVKSDLAEAKKEVSITIDGDKAAAKGLTAAQVAGTIRLFIQGQEAGVMPVDGKELPMYIGGGAADDAGALKKLPVGAAGAPLSDVATVKQVEGPVTITHSDGEPAVRVTGSITAKDTGRVSAEVQKGIEGLNLPAGTTFRMGGDMENIQDSFRDMGIAMLVAVFLVYLILVLFFGSLVHPFTIILSLPLASSGALGALLIADQALGMPSLLGMLMLIGIVVSNAILLVDFIQKARAGGMPKREAEIQAGQRRLRPILMTAIVTIGALIPLAAGLSGGILISESLATVVIGGLATSTLLTLLIIPAVYSLMDSARARFAGEAPDEGPVGGPIEIPDEAPSEIEDDAPLFEIPGDVPAIVSTDPAVEPEAATIVAPLNDEFPTAVWRMAPSPQEPVAEQPAVEQPLVYKPAVEEPAEVDESAVDEKPTEKDPGQKRAEDRAALESGDAKLPDWLSPWRADDDTPDFWRDNEEPSDDWFSERPRD